jgi:hypothetical protein
MYIVMVYVLFIFCWLLVPCLSDHAGLQVHPLGFKYNSWLLVIFLFVTQYCSQLTFLSITLRKVSPVMFQKLQLLPCFLYRLFQLHANWDQIELIATDVQLGCHSDIWGGGQHATSFAIPARLHSRWTQRFCKSKLLSYNEINRSSLIVAWKLGQLTFLLWHLFCLNLISISILHPADWNS